MKKVLIVAHNIRFLVQFVMNDVKILQDSGCEVHCAVNYKDDHVIDGAYQILENAGVKIHQIDCERSPFKISQNIRALRQLVRLIKKEGFSALHCHTPIGGILGRIGGKLGGVKKIIYTGHGFHFYKGSSLKSWLLYFPAEWVCSFLTDVIITINHEDFAFAKRHLHAGSAAYIPGVGVDLQRFSPGNRASDLLRNPVREKLNIPQEATMILSVGEVNDNKNHRVVLQALDRLKRKDLYYVICGTGPLEQEYQQYCAECGLSDHVILAGYQEKIEEYYHAADITVFPSKREGLGLAALEGMACGTPLIASDTRGSREYCIAGENSILCDYRDPAEFASAITALITNEDLRKKLSENGIAAARNFDVNIVREKMKSIYRALEL